MQAVIRVVHAVAADIAVVEIVVHGSRICRDSGICGVVVKQGYIEPVMAVGPDVEIGRIVFAQIDRVGQHLTASRGADKQPRCTRGRIVGILLLLVGDRGPHALKIGQHVMLMVNDRRFYSDTFWFTLFHEIGHIINGDYGITFENEHAGQEDVADKYAEDKLIPPGEYEAFVRMNEFSENAIRRFAERIDRDPGIVLGRLQNDQIVPFTNVALSKALKHKYKVITS